MGTGAKRPGKFRDATPTFGHASALVGVVKCNLVLKLYYRRTFASRNKAAGSAVLIIL